MVQNKNVQKCLTNNACVGGGLCPFPDINHSVFVQPETKSPETEIPPSLTPQLLLLYYVLHYEDVRLSNLTSLHHQAGSDGIKVYSTEFLSELPIKYLLRQAQCHQQSYAGTYSSYAGYTWLCLHVVAPKIFYFMNQNLYLCSMFYLSRYICVQAC